MPNVFAQRNIPGEALATHTVTRHLTIIWRGNVCGNPQVVTVSPRFLKLLFPFSPPKLPTSRLGGKILPGHELKYETWNFYSNYCSHLSETFFI